MRFNSWRWYYNKIQRTKIHISHKITHHAETKYSTQSYKNIKDTLHTMNTTQEKVKLSLQQYMVAYGVVRGQRSHIVQTIGSYMEFRLPALRRNLPPQQGVASLDVRKHTTILNITVNRRMSFIYSI
jgi:hypothetical protein